MTRRRDGGQATVETALVLPAVVVVVLMVLQVVVVLRAQLVLTHASREAARAVAVHGDGQAADDAIARSSLPLERVEVSVTGEIRSGQPVTVEVRLRQRTDVPLVGTLVGDVELRSSTTMVVE